MLATGSEWRRDAVGRWHAEPIPGFQTASVMTPDDVMAGVLPEGSILIFDDDHYYMGGVLAEALASAGHPVRLVTPAVLASAWTDNTVERERIHARLMNLGVQIEMNTILVELAGEEAVLACAFTARTHSVKATNVVLVAACVRSGHQHARQMDAEGELRARRELPVVPTRPREAHG